MSAIGKTRAKTERAAPRPQDRPALATQPLATIEPSRALVALAPAAALDRREPARRAAPFIAHLIATKAQHPQTRTRRRAEPAEASLAYTAALTGHPGVIGNKLTRSM